MTNKKTTAAPLPLWQYWRGLGGWNFYFLVKFALLWAGVSQFPSDAEPGISRLSAGADPARKATPYPPLDRYSAGIRAVLARYLAARARVDF